MTKRISDKFDQMSADSFVNTPKSKPKIAGAIDEFGPKTPEEVIRAAAAGFVGEQLQVPPMYSAKKVAGHKLYEYARAGKTVERKGVPVSIRELEILGIELPRVRMRIRCSKGTYIRTLVSDIGDSLGTGAAMESLLRTRVGEFALDGALRIGEIEAMAEDGTIASHIVPVEACFASCPAVRTRAGADRFLYNGNVLHAQDLEEGGEESCCGSGLPAGRVRVYDSEGRFCAVYQAEAAIAAGAKADAKNDGEAGPESASGTGAEAAPLTLRAEKMFLQN